MRWLRERQEWAFFTALWRADRRLAVLWWAGLIGRGVLPAVFAIATGVLVSAVQRHGSLAGPLFLAGAVFVTLQVLSPIHTAVSANLGDTMSAWLNDRLISSTVRPPGMGHLEDHELASDLVTARDFDLGMNGPPLSLALDFVASGLVELLSGVASAILLAGFAWWAAVILLVAWLSTQYLLRESAVWKERNTTEVRAARQDADYAYRLAVDPPAAKELRLFGLVGWTLERFLQRRTKLHELQYRATRMREKSVLASLVIVVAANVLVFWLLALAANQRLGIGPVVVYAQAAMAAAGALAVAERPRPAVGMPAVDIRFRDVGFRYPPDGPPVLEGFNLTIPAGSSLAIVGRNGSGKTTLAKLLCRLYDPVAGSVEADGVDLRDLDLAGWRGRVTAVFQDFTRFELTLRENVAPGGGVSDEVIRAALTDAGAVHLAELDTILSKAYPGGTDLSGGQWQRVALARALCAVRMGAGLVLLDEPTAQLDVRGESEIFERILAATRQCTTILVSHRFSTVRQADRICVVERGQVVELGTHDELMALDGRYRMMFELQASPFSVVEGEEEMEHDVLT
jgi:ABC-type transport system involved in cytochrome bd biosynthesis fused ATPase/permease subunit